MGKYYWSKKDKSVVKRGAKKSREGSAKHVPALGQVIWKADTSDIQQGAVDTTTAMGVFAVDNFNSVSQLSLALGEKEKELQKEKEDLAEAKKRHEQEIDQLKQEHEDRVQQWKNKANQLKH